MQNIIFLLLWMLINVFCENQKTNRLSVFSPPKLIEIIQNINKELKKEDETAIECEIASFGKYQYESRIIGEVLLANPLDACTLTENSKNQKINRNPFLLIERGGCNFVKKVYNAQESGKKVAIIYDNSEYQNNIKMPDFDHLYNINITSVFIYKLYGDAIVKFINDNPTQYVNLSLEFNQKRVENSRIHLWIDLISPNSQKMIKNFNPVRKKIIKNNFTTEPNFNIEQPSRYKQNKQNCRNFKYGIYCFPSADQSNTEESANNTNEAYDAEIINEIIRQICLYNQGEELWYQYYDEFSSNCYYTPYYYSKCSQKIINKISNLNLQKYNECQEDNIDLDFKLSRQQTNNEIFNIYYWPGITINNLFYHYNLDGNNFAEAICDSLIKIDDNCEAFLNRYDFFNIDSEQQQSSQSDFSPSIYLILTLVVIGLFIVFLISAYCFYIKIRTQILRNIDQNLNQIGSKYITINESLANNIGDNQNN